MRSPAFGGCHGTVPIWFSLPASLPSEEAAWSAELLPLGIIALSAEQISLAKLRLWGGRGAAGSPAK